MASHYYRQGGGPSMCMCIPRTIGLLRIGTVWSTWTEHSARCLTLLSAHHCPPLPLSQPMDGGPHAAHGATSQPGLWRILVQETPSRPARPSRKNALVLSLRTAYVHRYGARRTEHKHLAFFCRAGKTGLETLSRARAHLGGRQRLQRLLPACRYVCTCTYVRVRVPTQYGVVLCAPNSAE